MSELNQNQEQGQNQSASDETRVDAIGITYVLGRIKTIFTSIFQAKEDGKGLSENDFTNAYKEKLDGIEAGAEVNPDPATAESDGLMAASDKAKLDGIEAGAEVNPGAATQSADGLMSSTDKTKLDGIAEGATANRGTVTGITMNSTAKTVDQNGNVDLGPVVTDVSDKAPLNSPTFTGEPTVPTAQTSANDSKIANTAFVKNAIAAALDGRVELDFLFLQELPVTGVKGIFYFIPSEDPETGNIWEEYIWDTANQQFERIGSAKVDLTGYFNETNLPAITNAQIDAILAT